MENMKGVSMERVHKWRLMVRLLWVLGLVMSISILGMPTSVGAYTVAENPQCPSKYTCHYIIYDVSPPTYTTLGRYYQGSRGCNAGSCGAQRWQLYYANDYYWNGSSWVFSYAAGESGWYTNGTFDGYHLAGGTNAMNGGGLVQMQNQFYECTTSCYYWVDSNTNHYLT